MYEKLNFCVLDLPSTKTIDDLKDAIKEKQPSLLDDIRASELILFQVIVPDEGIQVYPDKINSPTRPLAA
ncbi:hypothetical protein BGZ76_005532, partial [Entomortierella beljakovae]